MGVVSIMKDSRLAEIKILLVDDNEHTLTLITGILRGLGIRSILRATTVLDALKLLRGQTVDLMISDLIMEPVDGLTLVSLIRTGKDSPNPALPIIVLSGHDDADSVKAAREVGVDAYLTKPVSPQALYQHILRVTRNCIPAAAALPAGARP